MSLEAVSAVSEAQRLLTAALDGGEAPDIQAATDRLARAVRSLGTIGAWHATPELRQMIARALMDGEAARIRTRYLGERARTRLARLQGLTDGAAPRYGRHGQYV